MSGDSNTTEDKEKKEKKKFKLSKEAINIIRTNYRNNMDLTAIADNKAHIMLTVNSLMITILVPLIAANFELLQEKGMFTPLVILFCTSIIAIILATLATRPNLPSEKNKKNRPTKGGNSSPFFFGNYYGMEEDEYMNFLRKSIQDSEEINRYIMLDLYQVGKVLGKKYKLIKYCYNSFLVGILLTCTATIVILLTSN